MTIMMSLHRLATAEWSGMDIGEMVLRYFSPSALRIAMVEMVVEVVEVVEVVGD